MADAGGLSYLGTLVRDTPTAANVRAYAGIVRERSLLRQLLKAGVRLRWGWTVFGCEGDGKVQPAATMPVTLVMLDAIRDFFLETGIPIAMKPAGGIRTAKQAIQFLIAVKETLGDAWLNNAQDDLPGYTLAGVLVRLDLYRSTALPQSKLTELSNALGRVRSAGLKVVLRFEYWDPSSPVPGPWSTGGSSSRGSRRRPCAGPESDATQCSAQGLRRAFQPNVRKRPPWQRLPSDPMACDRA